MNYKNTIYTISFILIILYSLLFFTFELYQYQKLLNTAINKQVYLNNIFYSILILIAAVILTLIGAKKTENRIYTKKQRAKRARERLEMINDFYTNLQHNKGLKNTSDVSLRFVSDQFEAQEGLIYLANYKNMQLQLLNSHNADLKKTSKIMNIYKGICGEAFSTKKIKKYVKNDSTLYAIPLLVNNKTVGVIQLKYDDPKKELELDKRDKTLIDIISNNLLNELEHDKNEKYLELIDKYVLLSSTNKEGDITYASKAFCRATGYKKEELLGDTHRKFRDTSMPNSFYKDMWGTIMLGKTWEGEMPNIKKDGSKYWTRTTIKPKYDFYNNIIGFDAIRTDITDKKVIEEISITDSLTKLYNRRYFDQIFHQQLNLAKRLNRKLVFTLLDIDHFKQYNDSYGHQMGDETLKKVAASLKSSLRRDSDLVFRVGGEEFALIYFVKKDLDAAATADKVRENIENLNIVHEKNSASRFVTISMGVYLFENSEADEKQVYKECDDLLYKAKQEGRNRIVSNLRR